MTIRTLVSATALLLTAAAPAALGDPFKTYCAKCHGDTGKADSPVGKALGTPALAGDAKVAAMSDADLLAAVKGNAKHAGFIKSLSDADLTAAAAKVKELAGGK